MLQILDREIRAKIEKKGQKYEKLLFDGNV